MTATLGELGEFRNGLNFSRDEKGGDTDTSLLLVNVKDVFVDGPRVDFERLDSITLRSLRGVEKFQTEKGDVFFSRSSVKRDGIGVVAMAGESRPDVVHCGFVIRYRPDQQLIDPLYLTYFLRSPSARESIINLSGGAAITNISQGSLQLLEIPVPDLPTQRRIAGILSAYDELSANNQRRIAILEEMARALYREWFVHYRAPGVVMGEDGVPEGWEVKRLDHIADVIDCLHSKKPEAVEDGTGLLLQLENIADGGMIDLSKRYMISAADYAKWTSRMELIEGDCVITNVGRIGAVAQIPVGLKAAAGRNMTGVRCKPGKLTPSYLIQYLLSEHMAAEIVKKKDPGTIMDSLNVKGIVRLDVPCPPMPLMERFEAIARPLRRQIEILLEKSANLRRTRDLLLPRLMNGRVEDRALEAEV